MEPTIIDGCRKVMVRNYDGATFASYVWAGTLYIDAMDLATEDAEDALADVARWGQAEVAHGVAGGCIMRFGRRAEAPALAERLSARDISLFSELVCLELPRVAEAWQEDDRVVAFEDGPHEVGEPEGTVYLVPHQDDELYTWGADIINRLQEGMTAIVLLTNGAACFVRNLLHDGGRCEELGDVHEFRLSARKFSRARDREFISSCRTLGVPARNIHLLEPRMDDLGVTIERTSQVIRAILKAHPFARLCAHAPREEVDQDARIDPSAPPHRDHCAVGKAVEALRRAGRIPFAEYCIEFYDLARFVRENPEVVVTQRRLDESYRRRYWEALQSYRYWDPDKGRYAVGWHSGVEMFEGAMENSSVYSFDPNKPALGEACCCADLVSYVSVLQDELNGVRDEAKALRDERDALRAVCSSLEEGRADLVGRVEVLDERVRAVEGSVSFRLGRTVTAIPRSLRDMLRGQ